MDAEWWYVWEVWAYYLAIRPVNWGTTNAQIQKTLFVVRTLSKTITL